MATAPPLPRLLVLKQVPLHLCWLRQLLPPSLSLCTNIQARPSILALQSASRWGISWLKSLARLLLRTVVVLLVLDVGKDLMFRSGSVVWIRSLVFSQNLGLQAIHWSGSCDTMSYIGRVKQSVTLDENQIQTETKAKAFAVYMFLRTTLASPYWPGS